MKKNRHAVIIGAGPAGLTAAHYLIKEITDLAVTVIEATPQAGGLSATIEYHGNRIDIGGHRFFSKSKVVNDLWQEVMPIQGKGAKDDIYLGLSKGFDKDGPDPEKTDLVMLIRNRVSRIFYRRKFFDYPVSLKPSLFINMGFINTIVSGISYIYSSIKKRPENSLEDFYINRFGKKLYNMFFEGYTEKVWGIHPSGISAAWGAQRVKGLSVIAVLKEALIRIFNPKHKTKQTSLIDQFFYPKLGPGQLWSAVAEKVQNRGAVIHFDSKVTEVLVEKGKVTGAAVISGGKKTIIPCDMIFSTMPIKDLIAAISASSGETVPVNIKKVADELPYRDFITVGLLVKKLTIQNKTKTKTVGNIVPDCWIYIQERDVKIGRLQIFNNWSPYMVKDYYNTVWIGLEYFCNEGDELWKMEKDAFIRFAVDELVKIGIVAKEDVLDSTLVKIQKAYPAYFGAYDEIEKIQQYIDSISGLYCLGRNGQHKYNNMDHSMLTAIEAVNLIKTASAGGKDRIWNVNTEQDYHENR
jgi:protoporphyrinogen oxidase